MKALLLSGGIDSAALAFLMTPDICFFVNYGQLPAEGELRASKFVASELNVPLQEINIDASSLGLGTMCGKDAYDASPSPEWWPFRNQLIATFAAAAGIRIGVKEIYIGSVKTDSFHVDGRRDFFEALDRVFSMQEGGISIKAPATDLTTEELVERSKIRKQVLLRTHSCHKFNFACGNCEGCEKHFAVLRNLGIEY